MKKEFYSLLELAEKLNLPLTTARELARKQSFPATLKLNNQTYRFKKSIIDK